MLKVQTTRKVSEQAFERAHRIARKEDIDRGGLYDSRSGAINIWCSPRDKPAGYGYEIRKGALNYPRDYIATITSRRNKPEKCTVRLELQVDPERGGTESLGRRAEPTNEELKWAREKLDNLMERGKKEEVMEEFLVCPFCGDKIETVAFIDFIRHISNHIDVVSVERGVEGNVIQLASGETLFPSDYVQKRVRK